jgi:DNA invertase Pin-like site-specific DNA recombinase
LDARKTRSKPYADAHDYQIVGTYREEAVPGKTGFEERSAFMSMLADLLGNGCRTIIVERLDRLAREFRVQEELLLYLMRKQLT